MSAPRAVLDIGSNTVRLLVGTVQDGQVIPLLDHSEFVRLGRDVDRTGMLQADRQEAAIEAIRLLATEAHDLGAEQLRAIATSAIRDATNGREFAARVQAETGVPVEIISGEEEAALTFRGATAALDLPGERVVCDLGGGSAEIIAAGAEGIRWARSTPLGSGRMTERYIRHDPPWPEEIATVQEAVRSLLADLPPASPMATVCTGGTASTLAAAAGKEGTVMTVSRVEMDAVVRILTSTPSADLIARYAMKPERAAVIAAGAATIATMAYFYDTDGIVVTRLGIREGTLLSGF